MTTFEELAIGEVFICPHENVKRPYRKLTEAMAASVLTGHRFFFVPRTEVAEAEAENVTSAAGLVVAFGVDVEVAKTAVVFLTLVGDKQAEADSKENQAAFFRKNTERNMP